MVNVREKMCETEGCGKRPSFGAAGTTTAEYCRQHARDGMVNVCRKANPFSGSSRGSRKRARYLHNGPTVSKKRAVALESTAGALTIPEIEGQKPPVKRDSSVKTEVHVSL
ncbi:unnamed protein product [Ascophyllum nodosum]